MIARARTLPKACGLVLLAIVATPWCPRSLAATPDDIRVEEYAPANPPLGVCTHVAFCGGMEIVTAGDRLFWREGSTAAFRESPLRGLQDAHSVAWHPGERLFYACDSGHHRLLKFADPSRNDIASTATDLAGIQLERPHDIVFDSITGWLYAINPDRAVVFRFKGFGREESALDLSEHLGYSRSLSLVDGKLYVIGSSAGKVVEIDDFARGKFRVHGSFGKQRDAPAGSWQGTGLVLNDADFYRGHWYVTCYFCPTYAAGEDCDERKSSSASRRGKILNGAIGRT